jgi:hypothetical protein
MNYLKVEGHGSLLRDPKTNSIVNSNVKEYNEYIARRKSKDEENQKIQSLEEDLSILKDDISEIKSLLREMLNGPRKD